MKLLRGFWAAPLAAGALLWASFAPLDLGTLAAVAGFAVLLLSMRLRGGEKAARQALVAGMVWFLGGLAWMQPLVSGGWVFVAFWCAAHEAGFAACLRPLLRRARDEGDLRWVVAAPLLHLGADMVRTVLFTGFPWLIPGYAGWANPVLLGSADLIGVHGSTLAIVALAAALAEVAARAPGGRGFAWRPAVPAAAIWAALAVWAAVKPAVESRPGPVFAVLQPAIPQKLKEGRDGRSPDELRAEMWRLQESIAAEARGAPGWDAVDAVVWAETMVPGDALVPIVPGRPFTCVAADPEARRLVLDDSPRRRLVAAAEGRSTLAGITSYDPGRRRTRNTAVLLDAAGTVIGHQDKQHLCPGGETLLFLEWLPAAVRDPLEASLEEFVGFVPDLEAGAGTELLALRTQSGSEVRLGVLICYESMFPSMTRDMAGEGADVLVNASNYGWFTGTAEMEQALAAAVFRAAELRRPVLLASNNGISAAIGPDGRIDARTDADVRTFLLAPTRLGEGSTPFAVLGEWAAWCLGAAGLALAVATRRGRRNEAGETS